MGITYIIEEMAKQLRGRRQEQNMGASGNMNNINPAPTATADDTALGPPDHGALVIVSPQPVSERG
jgi:hypothetical protein